MLRWILVCAMLLPVVAQEPAAPVWIGDFDKAVEMAKTTKKDLLVDFTGSDWCGWCVKLDKEVFAHEAFLKAAQAKYILVALDFPQGEEVKAKVPNPKRNEELQKKYEVRGFPSILLMDAQGDVYAQTGYQPGGPEAYVKHLEEIAAKGREAIATVAGLLAQVAKAKPTEKPAVLGKVLAALEKLDADSPAAAKLKAVAKEALTIDADNKLGLKLKAVKALLKSGDSDPALVAAAKELDPKNEQGLLEVCVVMQSNSVDSEEALKVAFKAIEDLDALGPIKDSEAALQLYANAAFWNKRFLKNDEAAKKYAAKALPLVKDNEGLTKALQGLIDGQ
ncbi:MAG: thioredoxin family protein [Planctomycetes bacterium]|nr:thioredoxin family protein [Planctomycetota bacterium]